MSLSMIPKAKEFKLIHIYLYICELYDCGIKYSCLRYSNNHSPEFTDQEILTIYLFAMHFEYKYSISQIYKFADEYLRSWFPKLPSYTAFNVRLNRLSEAFRLMTNNLINNFTPLNCDKNINLLDSMPIITCSGKRKAKVAPEITDKGYCSTKNLYFYGLRLHALSYNRPNTIPFPEELVLTSASENDLNVFKQYWGELKNRTFYGDKIYYNINYFEHNHLTHNSIMLTPVKGICKQSEVIKMRDLAYNNLYSRAVSKIRQPIESFFNWLIQKTDIQRASKVRSSKGLLVHIFGRIAAAFIYLIFQPLIRIISF